MVGTFILATLAKFIFVVELELDSSICVIGSFVFVNTSTIDVVRMFEANGLYSPVVVTFVGVGVADETTSREDDGSGSETEADADVGSGPIGIR